MKFSYMEDISTRQKTMIFRQLQIWQVVCKLSCWHNNADLEFLNIAKIYFSGRTTNKIPLHCQIFGIFNIFIIISCVLSYTHSIPVILFLCSFLLLLLLCFLYNLKQYDVVPYSCLEYSIIFPTIIKAGKSRVVLENRS